MKGSRKRRLHIDVAALALRVDLSGFARDQAIGAVGVNGMAGRAGDGVVRVAGFEPARSWSADSDGR